MLVAEAAEAMDEMSEVARVVGVLAAEAFGVFAMCAISSFARNDLDISSGSSTSSLLEWREYRATAMVEDDPEDQERPKHDPYFAKAMWKMERPRKRPFRHVRHNQFVKHTARPWNGRRGRR